MKTKTKKKVKKIFVFVATALILFFLALVIRFYIIKIRIYRDLASVYKDAELGVKVSWKMHDAKEITENFYWYGEKVPYKKLYYFQIKDSENQVGWGYADKNGNVLYDTYANVYYHEKTWEQLLNIIDFDKNFPGVEYYLQNPDPVTFCRLIYTHDCTSYEGYMNTRNVGFIYSQAFGFTGLFLGLTVTDEKTITKMNQLLKDANCEIYINYCQISGDISKAKIATDLRWDDPDYYGHNYHPYGGLMYDEVKLGRVYK